MSQVTWTLDLSRCDTLTTVDGLEGLTNLKALDLSGCENLTDLSVLSRLKNLCSLDLVVRF